MVTLVSQTNIVVKLLVKNYNMSNEDAYKTWMTSKTKYYLESNNLVYVSGMRCYWELCLELKNDKRWLSEPFDM